MNIIQSLITHLRKYCMLVVSLKKDTTETDEVVDKLSLFERIFYSKTEQEQRLLDKYEERTNKTCFKSKRYIERHRDKITIIDKHPRRPTIPPWM